MIDQHKGGYVFRTFFWKYVVCYIPIQKDEQMVGWWAFKRDRFFNIGFALCPTNNEWVKLKYAVGASYASKNQALTALMDKEFSLNNGAAK